ncbi:MAG: chalcone isomerase family protein [Thiolinea sp.]
MNLSRQRFTPYLLAPLLLLMLLPGLAAADKFPAQQAFAGQNLTLNGKGIRTKLFFNLYTAGLYLQQANKDANAIIMAEQPMALRLEITSAMITSETMSSAVQDGFKLSAGNNLPALQGRIDQLIKIFSAKINEGDIYDFVYRPQQTLIIKNGQAAGTISGADFKQALYAIWLGRQPVQDSLKKQLLGQ